MLKPREADVPFIFLILIVLPIFTYILLGLWTDCAKKKTRACQLAQQAAEETFQFKKEELEEEREEGEEIVMACPDVIVPANVTGTVTGTDIGGCTGTVPSFSPLRSSGLYGCATCRAPATTRCSRCKSVRYCSGKCQIIHWRQGHKDRCQQIPFPGNFNSPIHETDRNSNLNGVSNYESTVLTENTLDRRASGKLKQVRFRNEDVSFDEGILDISSDQDVSSRNKLSDETLIQSCKFTSETRKRPKSNGSTVKMDKKILLDKNFMSEDPADQLERERNCYEKGTLKGGGTVYKRPPYTLGHTVCLSQKAEIGQVKEHYFDGDEKSSLKKNESRSSQINNSNGCNGTSTGGMKNEITKKPSKFLKYNLVGLINDSKKNKILFPYEELIKFFQYEVRGISPRGLINCGNSCYANAVLQCLTCTKPLMIYLLKRLHSENCWTKSWCVMCEMEQHASMLRENGGPLSLIRMLSNLRNIGCRLGGGSQEDAHEFLRVLVMSMQSTCLEGAGGEKAVDLRLQESTIIQQIFGGRLKSKVKCLRCQHESERYENIMDLTLEIHGWVESLEDALTQFTTPEDLDGENMYRCSRCSAYVRARKELSVHEVPNILTIVLKRFQSGKYGKINKCVTFPEMLDMIPFVTGTADKPPLYLLYAVVVHLDNLNASFSGHYISYVKDLNGNWLRIDDSEVQVVQLSQVMSEGAYMLFYSRSFPHPPRIYMEKSVPHFPLPSKRNTNSKSQKSPLHRKTEIEDPTNERYEFRPEHRSGHRDPHHNSNYNINNSSNNNNAIDEGFASSADFSDATSSEWSLFTSSDESSFTTESTRDSFSILDYGENPSLDSFSSIFSSPFYGQEYTQGNSVSCTKVSDCKPQMRYFMESNCTLNGNNVRSRGRCVDVEGFVQTSGYCDM